MPKWLTKEFEAASLQYAEIYSRLIRMNRPEFVKTTGIQLPRGNYNDRVTWTSTARQSATRLYIEQTYPELVKTLGFKPLEIVEDTK